MISKQYFQAFFFDKIWTKTERRFFAKLRKIAETEKYEIYRFWNVLIAAEKSQILPNFFLWKSTLLSHIFEKLGNFFHLSSSHLILYTTYCQHLPGIVPISHLIMQFTFPRWNYCFLTNNKSGKTIYQYSCCCWWQF